MSSLPTPGVGHDPAQGSEPENPSATRSFVIVAALVAAIVLTWAIATAAGGDRTSSEDAEPQEAERTEVAPATTSTTAEAEDTTPDTTPAIQRDAAELAESVEPVSSGGEKIRDQISLELGDFVPELPGTVIVFVTVVMGNDSETVPPAVLNGLEPFATAEKNEVAARRLLAFAVPADPAVPLSLVIDFGRTLDSAKVSWTATFTEGRPGAVLTDPGAGLEMSLTVDGSEGLFFSGMAIGTSAGDEIEPDHEALGWQRGEASIGQTYAQWGVGASSLSATWTKPAHAMGMSVFIDFP